MFSLLSPRKLCELQVFRILRLSLLNKNDTEMLDSLYESISGICANHPDANWSIVYQAYLVTHGLGGRIQDFGVALEKITKISSFYDKIFVLNPCELLVTGLLFVDLNNFFIAEMKASIANGHSTLPSNVNKFLLGKQVLEYTRKGLNLLGQISSNENCSNEDDILRLIISVNKLSEYYGKIPEGCDYSFDSYQKEIYMNLASALCQSPRC